MKALKISMIAGLSALALSACSGNAEAPAEDVVVQDETAAADPMAADATAPKTIVALAQGNADLSTLVAAVTAAGLGETLSGAGPFTVFAPTDRKSVV